MSSASRPSIGMMLPRDGVITVSGGLLRDLISTVESTAVESVWATEHVVVAADYEPRYPYSPNGQIGEGAETLAKPDPLELLSYIAGISDRVLLGTGVVVAPLQSAVMLAKRTATLDRLSEGRLLLGVGLGWQREEFDAVGVPFADRARRLNDLIPAMRALWRDAPASYQAETVAFDRVYMLPQPERQWVPIIVGGSGRAAIARTAKLGDGWYPHAVGPADFAQGASMLRSLAEASGRDPEAIEITVAPGAADPSREFDVDWVSRYVEAGARRLILLPPVNDPSDIGRLPSIIERYQTEVVDAL